MIKYFLLFFLPMVFACQNSTSGEKEKDVYEQHSKQSQYSYEIFKAGNGYGYDILMNGNKVIHQPNIPAIEGNRGFSTEEDAKTVAEFAITKIERGIMPPTISLNELDSLRVLD